MTKFARVLSVQNSESVDKTEAPISNTISVDSAELLTAKEVLKILRKDNMQWLRDHTTRVHPIIPHIKVGRETLYPKSMFFAWMNSLVRIGPNSPR